MIVFGSLEDQTLIYTWGLISKPFFQFANSSFYNSDVYLSLFGDMLNPFATNMPISWLFVSIMFSLFGQWSFNLFLLFTTILNLVVSYLYFSKRKFAWIYAIIFTFSSYYWSHITHHPILVQLWIFPLFLMLYEKWKIYSLLKRSFLTGVFLTMGVLIENYLGFFLLILFELKTLIEIVQSFIDVKKIRAKEFGYLVLSSIITLFLIYVSLYKYINSNFLSKEYSSNGRSLTLQRPVEDFVFFSSRPWYFVLAPSTNPLLGDISTKILAELKNTNYFLADDYFLLEHAGNYFGLLLLIFTLIVNVYAFKNLEVENKQKILANLVIMFFIITLIMPPFFTVLGATIYTPNYLIYKFFPMFRSMARLGVLLHLLLLTILSISVDQVVLKSKFSTKAWKFILIVLVFITILETYVPVKVINYRIPPEIYTYLNSTTPEGSRFVVYPYFKAKEALFWLPVHERFLLNPPGFVLNNFYSQDFTKNLNHTDLKQQLSLVDADYFVLFKDEKEIISENNINGLALVKEFQDSLLYSVK